MTKTFKLLDRAGSSRATVVAESAEAAILSRLAYDNMPIAWCRHQEWGYAWPVKPDYSSAVPMKEVYMGGGWCLVSDV